MPFITMETRGPLLDITMKTRCPLLDITIETRGPLLDITMETRGPLLDTSGTRAYGRDFTITVEMQTYYTPA